jgi:hypothetical protein
MTSAKRQKLENAAFAASQPLFDTLRNAREQLPQQGCYLTTARDLVQTLHVGLQIDDGKNDVEKHAKYMDAIVEAWKSAADTYCDIFAQLTIITAEKPSEGRAAAVSHEDFKNMLETAQVAQTVARRYVMSKDKSRAGTPSVDTSHAVPQSKQQQEPPMHPTPTPAPKKAVKGTKYDKSGQRILWQNGELKVPMGTLGSSEKKEWFMVAKAKRREVERAKKAARQKTHSAHAPEVPPAVSEETHQPEPPIEYEDSDAVAAAVETRLKAKAEAKALKKANKKRKRESGDSFVSNDGDDASIPIPPAATESKKSEKPSKKKAKKANGASTGSPPPDAHQEAKRKTSPDAVEGGHGANAGKKRKKSKD